MSSTNTLSQRETVANFLVIGAMKCATTTLYQDLSLNPKIFLAVKELGLLKSSTVLSDAGRRAYAGHFSAAKLGQVCGDISTEYSKSPDYPDVATHARQVLGENAKIIYMVREPVARLLSHHQHMMNARGEEQMGEDINTEIDRRAELINYSRYAMQLAPWMENFGRNNIHVIVFEQYVRNRAQIAEEVFDFLRVPRVDLQLDAEGANRGESRRVANKLWAAIITSRFYRSGLRGMLPVSVRQIFAKTLLKPAAQRRIPPTRATLARIIDQLAPEALQLEKMLQAPAPFWDWDVIRNKYLSDVPAK
ncbi:MAG: sulfotransferase [Pirellulaceae bacterium]|nr:sulfotransferase [Pirellulaceae bacterium]